VNSQIDIEQALTEPRAEQEARRKKIERTKIRLEELWVVARERIFYVNMKRP